LLHSTFTVKLTQTLGVRANIKDQVGLIDLHLYKIFGVNMNNKVIGIVLIIIGVALTLWGYNIYDSAGSQVSRAIGGDIPIEAWAGIIGGVICIVIGISKVK
jgi:uncharacterized membrane protein YidH (DUF202 family)